MHASRHRNSRRCAAWQCSNSTTRPLAGSHADLPWGTYGLLCRASFTSPNLGVALKRWCRHQRLLTDDIALELVIEDEIATLQIEERRRFGALREFCLVTSLRCVHGFACWLIDSRIPLIETRFPFQRPPHGAVHSLIFPGPVHFAQDRACMRFAAEYLTLAPRRDERALQHDASARAAADRAAVPSR